MNLYGQFYRSILLPAFDGLIKGRKTVQYWRRAEQRQWLNRQELESHQLADLQRIVGFANAHCEYYRNEWSHLGLNPGSLQSFHDFHCWPLLTREVIRENRSRLQSQVSVKRITKSTGGSSGQPLVFDLDSESNERRTAMMYRGYSWAGCSPGTRRMMIWGADLNQPSRMKSIKVWLHHRFEQQRIMNCFEFSDGNLRMQFHRMNRFRPEVIVAYTNPLYEFCKHLQANAMEPKGVRSIIVGAEKLYDFQRELIERVFRAPVFETYGSREFMLIGAECDLHSGMHLSVDNLYVEVVNDDGTPTPDGLEGNVVITDLFNHGMPFIRYLNGDRAIAGFTQCACGRGLPLLRSVVGRQLDILSTPSGAVIPGELFPHLFKDFASIRRFQVHQHQRDEVEIRIVGDSRLNSDTIQLIRDKIDQSVGGQLKIRLERVDDIPLTAAGKHQVVVNHLARKRVSV